MFKLFRRDKDSHALGHPGFCVDEGDRVYAVGDIHGRADLLEAMIAAITADAARHSDVRQTRVVFLGDYIDRGDHSREVLTRLNSLKPAEHGWSDVTCLRGNHEAALLDFVEHPADHIDWLEFGGVQTLASYGVARPTSLQNAEALRETAMRLRDEMASSLDFLRSCPALASSGDVAFAHAGLDPDAPLATQPETALLWGTRRFLERGLENICCVHGHYDAPTPVHLPWRICVDTGAYYSGRLTAVRLDSEVDFLSVTA